jgi:protein involved in polysaccharide export with SLBB domain
MGTAALFGPVGGTRVVWADSGDAFMFQRRSLVLLLLTVILAGCSATAGVPTQITADAYTNYGRPGVTRGANGPYVLGPGDRLRVKVYNDADMTGEYEVGSSGTISIPLVGDVRASGKTTRQLEETLVSRMKGQISQDPKVNVEIAAYAPFYIFGEVRKAGEYPFRPGLTVADAVAMASGFTYRANEDKIYVRHAGSPVERVVPIGVPAPVFPGDNIRVAERYF